MKRIFAFFAALVLLCACIPAMALEHDFSGAFTVSCPDGWELDTTFGAGDSTEDFQVLGAFSTFASTMEVSISDDRAYYEDFSVPTVMDSEFYYYLAGVLAVLEEADDTVKCSFVKTVPSADGHALFLIYYVDDAAGGYYYADTMLGGCTLLFYAYADSVMIQTGARQLAELELLLSSIRFNDQLFQ